MTPIERMLEAVEWEACPAPEKIEPELPYATHHGIISFAGSSLRVYQLSNNQRVIDDGDLAKFFGFSTDKFREIVEECARAPGWSTNAD